MVTGMLNVRQFLIDEQEWIIGIDMEGLWEVKVKFGWAGASKEKEFYHRLENWICSLFLTYCVFMGNALKLKVPQETIH